MINLEKEISKCNNLGALRKIARSKPNFAECIADSLSPVKNVLSDVFRRLELKSKKLHVFPSATPSEIDDFWTPVLLLILHL